MKCTRTCGLSFKAFGMFECALEITLSGLIGALCVFSWIKEDKPTRFLYEGDPKDSYIKRNAAYESCVVTWCLTIIFGICVWRIISAILLFHCVRKSSASLGQYWLVYKMLVLMISSFVAIASFTAPEVKLVAILSCIGDIGTSYFMQILYPEIGKMKKILISVKSNKSDDTN